MPTASEQPFLSIVIPAYNEVRRLPQTLTTLADYRARQSYRIEVIVVDDGSTDETAVLLQRWAATHPDTVLLSDPQNHGKGYAVKTGVLAATGEFVLVMDADGAAPIEEVERLFQTYQERPAPIILGSRAMPSRETRTQGHWHRKVLGRLFTAMLFALVPGIYDTQCGFKLYVRQAAVPLFTLQTVWGYAFDVEILHAARRNGYAIREVPVNWTNVKGSKVNVFVDSWRMFFSLFRIAWHSLQGYYKIH
jgi:dolichyl-phosphate beta-glucosyltransferase